MILESRVHPGSNDTTRAALLLPHQLRLVIVSNPRVLCARWLLSDPPRLPPSNKMEVVTARHPSLSFRLLMPNGLLYNQMRDIKDPAARFPKLVHQTPNRNRSNMLRRHRSLSMCLLSNPLEHR